MQDDATITREWLEGVMRQTGLKASPLAKKAGLSPSTVLRALDPNNPQILERRSITKIARAFGLPEPGAVASPSFSDDLLAPDDDIVADGDLTPNQYLKAVGSPVLALAGYLPGDLLTLDMSVTPQQGDAVHAQIYDRTGAETVLRYYDPPYLVTRAPTDEHAAKPLLVDGDRVRIAAVVVRMQRWPRKKFA